MEEQLSIHDIREGLLALANNLLETDKEGEEGMGGRAGAVFGMLSAALLIVDNIIEQVGKGIRKENEEN